ALRRAVLEAEDRQTAYSCVVVRRAEPVQQRAHAVHRARMVAREQLEGEHRRAAARRARIVETAAEQLLLCTPAELADRTKRDRALAKVRAARGLLEPVAPLAAQIGELALGARLRELVGPGRRFGKRHCRDSNRLIDG